MVIRSRIRIPDHVSTSLNIAEQGILGHLLAFLIQLLPIFTTFGEMTNADKIMNPQNFGSDPADIRFRIRINREIRIRIPDHFWLKFWSRQWFALSENNLVTYAVFFRYNETICSTRNDLDKSWNATLTSWSIDTWDRISQGIIDEAIDQWQTRLHACVKAKDVTSNTYCDLDTQPALFRATYTPNCFISEPFTLLRGRQHKFSVCNAR